MANKRIKDLSTTAAVTASDDFIAVDGATNGTRKLDAYNPTFGGNLTVSGGTITGGTSGLSLASGGTNKSITLTPTGTGFTVIQGVGSKTSIGDFPLVTSYAALYQGVTTPGNANYAVASNGAELVLNAPSASYQIRFQVGSEVARLNASGNLLLGTTTDSGQKLQVSGTARVSGVTTVGGGSNDLLKLEADTAGNGGYLMGRNAADNDYTPLILIGNGLTLKYRTGVNSSANALAIDNSANATFAGSVKATTKLTVGSAASSPSIYGSSTVTVGTSAVDLLSTSLNTGAIAVVSGYNNSGGQQGVWLIIATGGGLISTVASQNATGLTPTFSISTGKLQMSLASGSMSVVTTILGVTGL